MNKDAQSIKAALDRRFARVATPPCPEGAWRAAATAPAAIARPRFLSRRFAQAAALLVVVAIGGIAAQAATSGSLHDFPFMRHFVVPATPMALIHRADRLTIAEAQRRMPFTIVEPKGLPAGSRLLYAHVISEKPIAHVVLRYYAHVASRYYDFSINESTGAVGPPVAHVELRGVKGGTKSWNVPLRRFKHGDIVMELHPWQLPAAMIDRIVRANTL